MTMLLTLCAGSLRSRMASPSGKGNSGMRMLDVPSFVVKQLQLHGLNIPASMLSGCSPADLDRLRDAADKAACPCLVLIEDTPRPLASPDDAERDAAASRVQRLAVAANRLGCNAIALKIEAPESDAAFDMAADQVRSMLPAIERLELNVLLAPHNSNSSPTAWERVHWNTIKNLLDGLGIQFENPF